MRSSENGRFSVLLAAVMSAVLALIPLSVAADAASVIVSPGTEVSTYVCDFENNYFPDTHGIECTFGKITKTENRSALSFVTNSSGDKHYFEIYNSNLGRFSLSAAKAYTVTVTYKAENIPDGDGNTVLNIVRYNGKNDTLVKMKAFRKTVTCTRDNDWITQSISFRINTDDEYKYLAVNVVCQTAPESPTKVESNTAVILFDKITVCEYGSDAGVIEFDTAGGSYCESLIANAGSNVSLPVPSKKNYDFDGWFTDRDCRKAFTKSTMPSAASTLLYAKWKVSADAVSVSFNSMGGTTAPDAVGMAGEPISLPASERDGFHFAGWCRDKKSNEIFSASSGFPSEDTILYAKWEVIPRTAGFENESAFPKPNNSSFTQRCIITDEEARHGKYSLKYDFYLGSSSGIETRAAVQLFDEYGKIITLKEGKTYNVTFSYKLAKAVEYEKRKGYIGTIGLICSNISGAWSDRKEQKTDKENNVIFLSEDDVGKWKNGSFKFTAEFAFESGNVLSIGVSGLSTVYLDDICVVEVDANAPYKGNMIAFESEGGSYCESVHGKYGDEIVLPDPPVREGFKFIGWCEDEECLVPFEGKSFERGYLVLYADWRRIVTDTDDTSKPDGGTAEQVVTGGGTETVKSVAEPENGKLWTVIAGAAVFAIIVALIVIVAVKKITKRRKNKC